MKDGSQYFVLLIITDGVISDMAQTKESIVNVRMCRAAINGSPFEEVSLANVNMFNFNSDN